VLRVLKARAGSWRVAAYWLRRNTASALFRSSQSQYRRGCT